MAMLRNNDDTVLSKFVQSHSATAYCNILWSSSVT